MAENLKAQTIKGVWWSSLERYVTQGVSFVITVIMARLLSPNEYGLIGMLAIFISLSQVFIDGGFSNALIQKKEKTDSDFSTVFFVNVGISIVIYILLYVTAPLIASFFNQPVLVSITRVYSLTLIVGSLSAVYKTKLTIDIDFKTQLKISLIGAVSSGAVGILCAVCGMGVWALVLQYLLSSLVTAIMCVAYVRWWPSFIFSKESFHSLFTFGSKLLIAQVIGSVYVNLYNLAIGKKYSSDQLGYYTRAGQFCQLLSTNLISIMTRVSFPVLSRVQDNNEQLMGAYRKFIEMAAFILFPLTIGMCGIAKPLILSLLSDKWAGSILLLQILSFAYLCDGITIINLNLLYVKGRSDLVMRLEIIKKSIAFIILFSTIGFGLHIICVGQVVYSLIAFYLNTIYTKKILGYGFREQTRDIYLYLVASLMMLAVELLLVKFILNCYISLAVCLIVSPVVFLFLCRLFKLGALSETCAILSNSEKCPSFVKRILPLLHC